MLHNHSYPSPQIIDQYIPNLKSIRRHQDKKAPVGIERYLERACDNCHEKKLRCERRGGTCIRCQKTGVACRFTKPILKRGRRKKNFTDKKETSGIDSLLINFLAKIDTNPKADECLTSDLFDANTSQLDSLEEHLIMVYFKFVQPFYPIFHKKAFIYKCHQDNEADLEFNLLLDTLCSAACPFLSLVPFDESSCPRNLSKYYHNKALEAVDHVIPSVFSIQAILTLLTIDQADKHRYIKLVFSMATHLNIHKAHLGTEDYQLWTCCQMLDINWSLVQNTTRFMNTSPNLPHLNSIQDSFNKPNLLASLDDILTKDDMVISPYLASQFHYYYIQLAPLMSRIGNLTRSLTDTQYELNTLHQFEILAPEAELLETLLLQWLGKAADSLRHGPWGKSGMILLTLIRIYHLTLTIHLHLPFALMVSRHKLSLKSNLTRNFPQVCLTAAHTITDLASSMGEYFVFYGHQLRNHARIFSWVVFDLFDPHTPHKSSLLEIAHRRLEFKFGLNPSLDALDSQYQSYSQSILANYGATFRISSN